MQRIIQPELCLVSGVLSLLCRDEVLCNPEDRVVDDG